MDDDSETSSKRARFSTQNGNDSDKEDDSRYTKGTWSREEDDRLVEAVQTHGTDNWKAVASMVTGRSAKQCRDRYKLKLDPTINHGPWTKAEDDRLIELANEHGRAWTKIARNMPGRTENAVKSRISSLERSRTKDWSPDEDSLLAELKRKGLDYEQMTNHFPNRSSHAIKKRWETLHMDELAKKLRQDMNPKPGGAAASSAAGSPGSSLPDPVLLGNQSSSGMMQQPSQNSNNASLSAPQLGLMTPQMMSFASNGMPLLNTFSSHNLLSSMNKQPSQQQQVVAQPPAMHPGVQNSRMVRHSTSMTVLLQVLGGETAFQNASPLRPAASSTLRDYPSFTLSDSLQGTPSLDAPSANADGDTPAQQLLRSLMANSQASKSE